mmetsp:Transcript_21771/g.19284  ORF Transcript_21771/g.19284 Transcript_21771/m.19284 type:complete len:252 (+) Transcript_21771:19-774(+)
MNVLIVLGIVTLFVYTIFVDATLFMIYLPIVGVYWILNITVCNRKDSIWKRRKIAISSWNESGDPSAYLPAEYDVTDLVDYIDKANKKNEGHNKLTLTYAVAKTFGIAFTRMLPNVGRIAFGQFRPMKHIDIAILADVNGGKDLVPVTLKTPHTKSLNEIAQIIKEKATRAKKGEDTEHNKNFKAADFIPSFIFGPVLTIIAYLSLNLGWNVPIIGAKGDQYPPIVLTNVGSFGLEAGFAPLPPMASMCCC